MIITSVIVLLSFLFEFIIGEIYLWKVGIGYYLQKTQNMLSDDIVFLIYDITKKKEIAYRKKCPNLYNAATSNQLF